MEQGGGKELSLDLVLFGSVVGQGGGGIKSRFHYFWLHRRTGGEEELNLDLILFGCLVGPGGSRN